MKKALFTLAICAMGLICTPAEASYRIRYRPRKPKPPVEQTTQLREVSSENMLAIIPVPIPVPVPCPCPQPPKPPKTSYSNSLAGSRWYGKDTPIRPQRRDPGHSA